MKVCTKCNLQYDDSKEYCPKCGNKLTAEADKFNTAKTDKKKIVGLVLFLILILIAVGIGCYYYFGIMYNNDLIKADAALANGNYSESLTFYNKAENIRKSSDLNQKIKDISIIIMGVQNYNIGIKPNNDKSLLEAIDILNKVDKQDEKLYSKAQKIILKCKDTYINSNLSEAKDDIKNGNIEKANNSLYNIFKIDANNKYALELKNIIKEKVAIKERGEFDSENEEVEINKSISSTEPFGLNDISVHGIKLDMSMDEVKSILGKLRIIEEGCENEIGNYIDCRCSFGELDFWEDVDNTGEYFLASITLDSSSSVGPRHIKIGDKLQTVVSNFPNKDNRITNGMKILYGKEFETSGIVYYNSPNVVERVTYLYREGEYDIALIIHFNNNRVSKILLLYPV